MEKEGNHCLQTGQWAKGAHIFSQLLFANTFDVSQKVTYLLKRSECCLQTSQFQTAINDSRLVIALFKDNATSDQCNAATSNLVQALFLTQQFAEAERVLREWLALLNQSDNVSELLERLRGAQNSAVLRNELSTIFAHNHKTIQPQLCTYCNLEFCNKNELREHCRTEDHRRVVMSDDGRDWYWRPPPRSLDMQHYSVCKYWAEKASCRFGNLCLQAHGHPELDEWKERIRYRFMRLQRAYDQKLLGESYTMKLLGKLKNSLKTASFLKDNIEHVQITCCDNLTTTVVCKSTEKTWTFSLTSVKPIQAVALLHDAHRTYFEIVKIISEMQHKVVTYVVTNNQEWLRDASVSSINHDFKYVITIKFCTDVYGTFRQSVIFDFGADDIVCKNLCVDLVPAEEAKEIEKINREIVFISKKYWTDACCDIVKFTTLDESYNICAVNENEWTNLYPLSMRENYLPTSDMSIPTWSRNNYRIRMHTLLFLEEMAQNELINKFNFKSELHIVNSYMLITPALNSVAKYSSFGELYAYMKLKEDISEDTSWGRLLLNNCSTVLFSVKDPKVYEAVLENKGKRTVYLRLSATTVSDLGLQPDCKFTAQLQFQLNRVPFCERHYAVDRLPDLEVIFPKNFVEPLIPWSPDKQWSSSIDPRLNIKQKEAIIAITAPVHISLPPILLIGPFGTGKTFTFAQAVKELIKQKDTRILICTHSNSAADIYIKDYFHEYYEEEHLEARPLRIYYQKRWVYAVNEIVQQYCLIKEINRTRVFQLPTIEDIEKHRIIVVTLSTSLYLCNLGLPQGFFTHILLDEAAQTTECEAIMPLLLATSDTRIVLAGDHMQLSPEIHSTFAKQCKLHVSLLERMYDHYPAVFPCKILLCENYRAHEAIVDFTSQMFYEQKLVASGKQTRHPDLYPLTFFTVRGEDVQDVNSTAFYNNSEAHEVVERVVKLKENWPEVWGPFDEQSVGVLTPYSDQVVLIRHELRKRHLRMVSVERVLNVQGKQFRAIFLSIVRTGKTCTGDTATDKNDYGFLSDSKLLNTAITRAQSLVAVVGDPIVLCTIGKCSKIWEKFLHICSMNCSLNGITWSNLKYHLDGIELKKIYGLNPLALEFVPQSELRSRSIFFEWSAPNPPLIFPPPLPAWPLTLQWPPIRHHIPTPIIRPYSVQRNATCVPAHNIQSLNRVHVPNAPMENDCSLPDLMNLLPTNMSLVQVLTQSPQFHSHWYQKLLSTKGLKAAKSFEYLIEVSTNVPINGNRLSVQHADSEGESSVNRSRLDRQEPQLHQCSEPVNETNLEEHGRLRNNNEDEHNNQLNEVCTFSVGTSLLDEQQSELNKDDEKVL